MHNIRIILSANDSILRINDFDDSQKNNLSLIDAKGNEILFQTIKSQKTEFNISQIKSSVYYFRVVKNETILYYKLVKID